MDLKIETRDQCWFATVSNLDGAAITEEELNRVCERIVTEFSADPRHVVINFVGIGFMPTSAVRSLSRACGRIRAQSYGVSFLNLPDNIRGIITNSRKKPPRFHNDESAVNFLVRKMAKVDSHPICCNCN